MKHTTKIRLSKWDKRERPSTRKPYLDVFLVAVLIGRPCVVVEVKASLLWRPAAVIEGGRGGDLVIADLAWFHAKRIAAVEIWEKENIIQFDIGETCNCKVGSIRMGTYCHWLPSQSCCSGRKSHLWLRPCPYERTETGYPWTTVFQLGFWYHNAVQSEVPLQNQNRKHYTPNKHQINMPHNFLWHNIEQLRNRAAKSGFNIRNPSLTNVSPAGFNMHVYGRSVKLCSDGIWEMISGT